MVGKRGTSKAQGILDAISTLKRVTGTPNSQANADECQPEGLLLIHTNDHDSALVLANLLSQSLMKIRGHTEKYWSNPKNSGEFHDYVKVISGENNEYRIHAVCPPSWFSLLTDNINQKAQSLIAPDKNPSRSR
jgi:hypothetical protein